MHWDNEQRAVLDELREAYRAKARQYARADSREGDFLLVHNEGQRRRTVRLGSGDFDLLIDAGFLLNRRKATGANSGTLSSSILAWDAPPPPAPASGTTIIISGSGNAVSIQSGTGNVFSGGVRTDGNLSDATAAYGSATARVDADLAGDYRAAVSELLAGAMSEGRQFPPRSVCVAVLLAAASDRASSSAATVDAIDSLAAAIGFTVTTKGKHELGR